MKTNEITVTVTLTEEMLGMQPSDPEITDRFIASNAPNAKSRTEEIKAIGVEAMQEKSKTIFPKLADGTPFVWDYQIKGFFKDACGCLARIKGMTESSKLKAYKKIIDGLIFVKERKVPIIMPIGEAIGTCQRPLRAQTMQGERVALASSETVPEGSMLTFTIQLLDENLEPVVHEWLEYGALRGFGQWRNSGKGKFTYKVE